MNGKSLFLALAIGTLSYSATAGDFDGSRNLLCAAMDTAQCQQGGRCELGLPEDVNIKLGKNDNRLTLSLSFK